jgi:hypothetical protein
MTPLQTQLEVKRLSRLGRLQLEKLKSVSDSRIANIYNRAAVKIAGLIELEGQPPARLAAIQRDIEKEIAKLSPKVSKVAKSEIGKATTTSIKAVEKSSGVYNGLLPKTYTTQLTRKAFGRVYNRSMKALMINAHDGIELSSRIWDINQVTLRKMRDILRDGYLSGLTDSAMQRQIKSLLLLPNVDMRTKFWKDFFKQYPPGRGVYKSAHKNVMRVIGTEINESYRRAAAEYASEKSWVLGVGWELVAGHAELDICDDIASSDYYGLGEGVYPPDAVPITPHPQCLCYTITVPRPELMPTDPPAGSWESANNLKEIENLAKSKYPKMNFGFNALDPVSVRSVMANFETLLKIYPWVVDFIRGVVSNFHLMESYSDYVYSKDDYIVLKSDKMDSNFDSVGATIYAFGDRLHKSLIDSNKSLTPVIGSNGHGMVKHSIRHFELNHPGKSFVDGFVKVHMQSPTKWSKYTQEVNNYLNTLTGSHWYDSMVLFDKAPIDLVRRSKRTWVKWEKDFGYKRGE